MRNELFDDFDETVALVVDLPAPAEEDQHLPTGTSRRVTRSSTRKALASLENDVSLGSTTPRRKTSKSAMPGSCKSATPHRLKKKAKLAITPRTAGGSVLDCMICMDQCGTEGGQLTLGCCHSFCCQCIATHTARQVRHELPPSCPLCKGHLTEQEVVSCGPPKEMQEESEDEEEEEPVLVVMEFDEEDGEKGFWLMLDADEDGSDWGEEGYSSGEEGCDSGEVECDSCDEGEEDSDAGDENEGLPGASIDLGKKSADADADANVNADGQDPEEVDEDDPRPYGGWRWSASHRAWVGNQSVSCPPPPGLPVEEWGGPDPLEGQVLRGLMSFDAILNDAVVEAAEDDTSTEDGDQAPEPIMAGRPTRVEAAPLFHTADGMGGGGVGNQEAMIALTLDAKRMSLDPDGS